MLQYVAVCLEYMLKYLLQCVLHIEACVAVCAAVCVAQSSPCSIDIVEYEAPGTFWRISPACVAQRIGGI